MQPNDPDAVWPRRAAIFALAAALAACSSLQAPRETPPPATPPPPPPSPPSPPSAPDDFPTAEMIARINPEISAAVARAIEHVLRQPSDHPRAAVVDFSAHSTAPRFHVIDRASGRVLHTFRVAHGHGSEGSRNDGYAEVFSNVPNTNASSLGLYRAAETYISEVYPGLAMRLDGLSPTNSNARARFIVIHAARYMEPETWKGKKGGRPGLSDGCFVFSKSDRDSVVSALEGGALIYAVYEKP